MNVSPGAGKATPGARPKTVSAEPSSGVSQKVSQKSERDSFEKNTPKKKNVSSRISETLSSPCSVSPSEETVSSVKKKKKNRKKGVNIASNPSVNPPSSHVSPFFFTPASRVYSSVEEELRARGVKLPAGMRPEDLAIPSYHGRVAPHEPPKSPVRQKEISRTDNMKTVRREKLAQPLSTAEEGNPPRKIGTTKRTAEGNSPRAERPSRPETESRPEPGRGGQSPKMEPAKMPSVKTPPASESRQGKMVQEQKSQNPPTKKKDVSKKTESPTAEKSLKTEEKSSRNTAEPRKNPEPTKKEENPQKSEPTKKIPSAHEQKSRRNPDAARKQEKLTAGENFSPQKSLQKSPKNEREVKKAGAEKWVPAGENRRENQKSAVSAPPAEKSLIPRESSRPAQEKPEKEKTAKNPPTKKSAGHPAPPDTSRAESAREKRAMHSGFTQFGLSREIMYGLADADYLMPTDIQQALIPVALAGHDLMGQSRTGTGKTAAFAIPILETIKFQEDCFSPQALILVPTRELAVQVKGEIRKLSEYTDFEILSLYGGTPLAPQVDQLRAGADIIVGTPGRILDHIKRQTLKLDRLKVVVLDEADRMLDVGFRPDIEKILRGCPQARQTMLLTATLSTEVRYLAKKFMREPVILDCSPKNLAGDTIEQYYFTVDPELKFDLLEKLLEREEPRQAIIFCRTKRGTDRIYRRLQKQWKHADVIHGDLQQRQRDRVMELFRSGKTRYLVATDVVGRGIDVTNISHIINYDIPAFCDDYVHRVGRTGRMGREGVAFTFVTPEEGSELTKIEMRINRLLKRDEIPGFLTVAGITAAWTGPGGKSGPRDENPAKESGTEEKEPQKPSPSGRTRRLRRAL